MDDSQGERTRRKAAEDLILRTIAAHADSLLRMARRHSICVDDAQDAYQRSIEIFMAHAQRLDPVRAAGWLHVVVKREAQAIRAERQKLLSTEVNLDARESRGQLTPEERLLSFDMVSRSAEALKRLKPHELRALWLRAQGHSYVEIEAMTGWSYSKVNRCMSEGRKAFLERYEGIESGAECERWLPVICALVDGEAAPEQLLELRPHLRNCPGCRATLKAMQDSTKPLAALLPVPLLVVDGGVDHVLNALMRLYEGVAGGLHERAVNSFTKTQALVEASAAGKVAAVAASAAAVAGGGYASVERVVEGSVAGRQVAKAHVRSSSAARLPTSAAVAAAALLGRSGVVAPSPRTRVPKRDELANARTSRSSRVAPEFRPNGTRSTWLRVAANGPTTHAMSGATAPPRPPQHVAPEFARKGPAPEFGP